MTRWFQQSAIKVLICIVDINAFMLHYEKLITFKVVFILRKQKFGLSEIDDVNGFLSLEILNSRVVNT